MKELYVYAPLISACNSERMVKIGAELPKLSQNKTGYPFFLDHPVGHLRPIFLCHLKSNMRLSISDR